MPGTTGWRGGSTWQAGRGWPAARGGQWEGGGQAAGGGGRRFSRGARAGPGRHGCLAPALTAPTSEGNCATRRSARKAALSCRHRARLCCTQATRCSSSAPGGGPGEPCIPASARGRPNQGRASDRRLRGARSPQIGARSMARWLPAAMMALQRLHGAHACLHSPLPRSIRAPGQLVTSASVTQSIAAMASHAAAACCLGSSRPARSSHWGGIAVEPQSRQARFSSMAARASVNVQPFGSPPPVPAAATAAPDLQALQQQLESAAQRLQSTASGVQLPDVQLPTSVDTQQAASVAAQVGRRRGPGPALHKRCRCSTERSTTCSPIQPTASAACHCNRPHRSDPTCRRASLLQAAGAAAGALGRTAAAAAAPLDVFGGQWALNLLFVAVSLVFAYSLIALAPRQ